MEPIDPLEAERDRIAAEIHDGLLPYLFAAAAKLSALRRSSPELSESLADAAEWVDRCRDVARDVMSKISLPDEVIQDPLAAAKSFINSIVIGSEDVQEVACNWSVDSPLHGNLPPEVAAATYRIVCESVRNAVRHSGATRIEVSCSPEPDSTDGRTLRVEIRDNGCGIDSSSDATPGKHGMSWMKMRAAAAGIEFRIKSTPTTGTDVSLIIPLTQTSEASK